MKEWIVYSDFFRDDYIAGRVCREENGYLYLDGRVKMKSPRGRICSTDALLRGLTAKQAKAFEVSAQALHGAYVVEQTTANRKYVEAMRALKIAALQPKEGEG